MIDKKKIKIGLMALSVVGLLASIGFSTMSFTGAAITNITEEGARNTGTVLLVFSVLLFLIAKAKLDKD